MKSPLHDLAWLNMKHYQHQNCRCTADSPVYVLTALERDLKENARRFDRGVAELLREQRR